MFCACVRGWASDAWDRAAQDWAGCVASRVTLECVVGKSTREIV